MRVVFDATAFIADFGLAGAAFRAFASAIDIVDLGIFVPQVVLDETVNKYRETIRRESQKAEAAVSLLERITRKDAGTLLPRFDIDGEVEEYNAYLTTRLEKDFRATVLGYPSVAHADLVRRDLARRRPFRETGKGYRDCLIWHTVLAVCADSKPPVGFVTANASDFALDGRLHPELVADLAPLGLRCEDIVLFTSLDDLLKRHVEPQLQTASAVKEDLLEGGYRGFSIEPWVHEECVKYLNADPSWLAELFEFPWGAGKARIKSVAPPLEVDVPSVTVLSDGNVWARIYVTVDARFEVELDDDDIDRHPSLARRFDWWYGENDIYRYGSMEWEEVLRIKAGIGMLLSVESGDVLDFEVDEVGLG